MTLLGLLFFAQATVRASSFALSWLPSGRMNFQAFSVRPDRLPEYDNKRLYKSFILEAYTPLADPAWSVGFLGVQAGRTTALEKVGDYQTANLSIAIQNWQILILRDIVRGRRGYLVSRAGMGSVLNQFERMNPITIDGVNLSAEAGLDPEGIARSGVRVQNENFSLPLGANGRLMLSKRLFIDGLLTHAFLMDISDVLEGSSPFSGWSSMMRLAMGMRLGRAWEVFGGYLSYVNHMAAPTGQQGLRLRAGATAPEGIYVLWQENEVRIDAALVGVGFYF